MSKKYYLITVLFTSKEFKTNTYCNEVIDISPCEYIKKCYEFNDGNYVITMAMEISEKEFKEYEGYIG